MPIDKTLIMCCTKNRPLICKRMYESFLKTKGSKYTQMIFCYDYEDTHLATYHKLFPDEVSMIAHPNYQTPMFNMITKVYHTDYDYYGLINDDHIFRTDNWDIELIKTIKEKGNGYGIAHANSLWFESDVVCRHPSAFLISTKTIKPLTYAIYPELRHFKIDTYLRDLTEPLGLLFYREDIVIEHMHAHQKKAEMDDNYTWGYCAEEQALGDRTYAKWRLVWADKDREKIKKAIEKERGINAIS